MNSRDDRPRERGERSKTMKKNMQRLGGRGGLSLEAFANAKSKNNAYNPALLKRKREFYKNAKFVNKYKKLVKQENRQTNPSSSVQPDEENKSADDGYKNKKQEENVSGEEVTVDDGYKHKRHKENNSVDDGYKHKRQEENDSAEAVTVDDGYKHKRHKENNSVGDRYKRKRHIKNLKGSYSLEGLYEKKREEEEKARMEREAIFKAKKEEKEKAEARRKDLRQKMYKKTRKGQPVMKYRIEHILETLQGSSK